MRTKTADGKFELGKGASYVIYTDRHAGTVANISEDGKTVTWRQDKAVRIDKRGPDGCQDYIYGTDLEGPQLTFTLRKNGRWKPVGSDMKSPGCTLIYGREEFYDYSF